jgi:hypothetical protein
MKMLPPWSPRFLGYSFFSRNVVREIWMSYGNIIEHPEDGANPSRKGNTIHQLHSQHPRAPLKFLRQPVEPYNLVPYGSLYIFTFVLGWPLSPSAFPPVPSSHSACRRHTPLLVLPFVPSDPLFRSSGLSSGLSPWPRPRCFKS